jgi:hypothetical protein
MNFLKIEKMKKLIIILFVSCLLCSCDYGVMQQKDFTERLEEAYFEGQKDAINGDIRIKMNKDSCYVWIKSPWDEGMNPVYIPTYLSSKK